MQHSISERILKIGSLVFEFIHCKQKYKSFFSIILVLIKIKIIMYIYSFRLIRTGKKINNEIKSEKFMY